MDFKEKVFTAASQIPAGRISTYKEIACALGDPGLARAVGNALNKNTDPIKVPCHRVIRSDGSLGGYNRGPKKKARLLASEGIDISKGIVTGYRDLLYRPKKNLEKR